MIRAEHFGIINALSLLILFVLVVVFFKYKFRYWEVRGVPTVEKPTIPWGTYMSILDLRIYIGEYIKRVYDKARQRGYKLVGRYKSFIPSCLVTDPQCIKNVLQQDFNHFVERGFYYNEKNDPLSANLFAIGGDKWRILRKHLSPAFTPGKLKLLFDDMLQCAYQMKDAVEQTRQNGQPVNIQDIFERYTIDVIGSCVFGLQCDSFKNPHSEFRRQGRKIFYFNIWRVCKAYAAFTFPELSNCLGIRLFEDDTTRFFVNIVRDTLAGRSSNVKARKNFLQLLLDLQEDDKESMKHSFSVEELTAQVFIFFAAGFETSSITLTFCLYELAVNTDVQDKLREEICDVVDRHSGKITYDAIMEMKYLNQVVDETLRKYPPVSFITRVCAKGYNMPGTTAVLEKGTEMMVSILGLHRDPQYYADPDKFDPERFSYEKKQQIPPFTYLPFGEGPRICIGMRFGLLQVKAGLATLLHDYQFTLNPTTKFPLELKLLSFTMTPKQEILLDAAKHN